MIKANIKIGAATIQVEAEKQVDLVKAAGFWGECPDKCGNCSSPNIGFFERSPGGNLYVGLKCKECKCEFNFGQNKDGGYLYVKRGEQWNPEYTGNDNGGGGNQGEPTRNQAAAASNMDDDDIPY